MDIKGNKTDDNLIREILSYLQIMKPTIENDSLLLNKELEALQKGEIDHIGQDISNLRWSHDLEIEESLTKILLKDNQIKELHTFGEIFFEVGESCVWFSIISEDDETKKTELVNKFINHFKKLKHYESIIFIYGIHDLPIGVKFKNFEIIKQPFDNERIRSCFDLLKQISTYKPSGGIDYNKGIFCKVNYQCYLNVNTRDIVYSELELPFSIISYYTEYDLDIINSIGITISLDGDIPLDGPVCDYFPTESVSKMGKHDKNNDKYLEILSNILQKTKYNLLEEKILKSLRLFGLSRLSHRNEIRFLIVVSACECLLLSGEDRDYSTLKISEKTASLLRSGGKERYELYRKMKSVYSKRSQLVHQGDASIGLDELKFIEMIYHSLINKLLEENQRYELVEKELKDKSLAFNYFFDKYKFNF